MTSDASLASKIVLIDPKTLVPHPDRKHAGTTLSEDDGRYQNIKDDIAKMGIENPIQAQKGSNVIISGHTRHRIALELGMAEVPVIFHDVDDIECRYMMATDNYKRIGDEIDPMKKAWTFDVVVSTEGFRNGGNRRSASESTMQTLNNENDIEILNSDNKYNLSEIANRFGMKRANFIRYLDLLKLIPEFQELVSRQCVGVKTGSIVSHWSREEQLEYYRGFPLDELQKQDFRITEQDAIEWHKLLNAHTTNDGDQQPAKVIAALINDTSALNKDGMLEIGFEDDEEVEDADGEDPFETEQSIVDIVNALDGGGKRPKEPNEVELGAGVLQFIYDHPDRLQTLRTLQMVEESRGKKGEESALEIEEATKDVAKRYLLMEDLDKRFDFAEQQLETTIKKCKAWLKKSVEGEIFPLQIVLAGRINDSTIEIWNDLGEEFRKIANQFEAAAGNFKSKSMDNND